MISASKRCKSVGGISSPTLTVLEELLCSKLLELLPCSLLDNLSEVVLDLFGGNG
jgi:hypothetical protein